MATSQSSGTRAHVPACTQGRLRVQKSKGLKSRLVFSKALGAKFSSTQCPNSAHCHWKGLQQMVVGALSQLQQKGSPGHMVRSRSCPFHGEGRVMLVSQSSLHSCALCCSSARRLLACCPGPSSRGWSQRGFAADLGGSPLLGWLQP